MNDDEIYEYSYLDFDEASFRENVIDSIYEGNYDTNKIIFSDLEMYLNGESIYEKILKKSNESRFNDQLTLSNSQIELLGIMEDKNVFLSAPTSFGKTFIILEYIARHIDVLNNIVFIIPTLALMNELLKKIYARFSDTYNICINSNESFEKKNIFIFVPERSDSEFVKNVSAIGLDLVIIDEIYKLKPKDGKELAHDDRIIIMNKVYLELLSSANKIFLLGPFIKNITFERTNIDIVKYYTNLNPIHNYVYLKDNSNWLEYMGDEKELVYFEKPESIYKVIPDILKRIPEDPKYIEKYKEEIYYLEENVSKHWYAIDLLKRGIGVHHGKTPIYMRKFYENEFNSNNLKCLLCTSTLMEGINTPTMKLLVVESPKTIFKLNNLIGRVGRLNTINPCAGKIYLFDSLSCNMYKERNNWENLTILAEDNDGISYDEVLFFDKKLKKRRENDRAKDIINEIIKYSNKSIDELKKIDFRVKAAYRFICGDYITKFNNVTSLYECVKLSNEIIGKQSYNFQTSDFTDLNYSINVLPYIMFMQDLITKKTVSEIIEEFEKDNGKLSVMDLNLMIDKLLKLRTHIKFKFIKIQNYFTIFNIDITTNKVLNKFVRLLDSFEETNMINKILDDLGIEEKDFNVINEIFDENDIVSTSRVIKKIQQNKQRIIDSTISPFTKRNINNL